MTGSASLVFLAGRHGMKTDSRPTCTPEGVTVGDARHRARERGATVGYLEGRTRFLRGPEGDEDEHGEDQEAPEAVEPPVRC